jgi:hypothetical protein
VVFFGGAEDIFVGGIKAIKLKGIDGKIKSALGSHLDLSEGLRVV